MPFRVIHTSDLHYGYSEEGDASTREMAFEICARGGDALVITGDMAIRNPQRLHECLALFEGFDGPRAFVAGNHDLWCPPSDPMTRYTTLLAEIGEDHGFHYLERTPLFVGDVAFVGSVGWYDYEFKNPDLDVDPKCYTTGSWPGVTSWNDRHWMPWELSDEEFTSMCVDSLARQLQTAREKANTIVACLHHLPFRELVLYRPDKPDHEFCNAFTGSPRFGEALLAEPRAELVLCGHVHRAADVTVGHVRAVTNGSSYRAKVFGVYCVAE